ncbi:hypothetical protein LPB86_14970 [Pedobacter sp. MC2016-14]|uniref:SRPBCC family protein n=1 Tax=Pedobacter sp. MC2016-14 TaxID=2897327 RepID=UPI001E3C9BCC|nr:SRPBCC family protein [Pedobacter sp. MC2016-14]MCD0489542.1 hypothetical protein [Pedobacter sp. MC2016-14]
MKKIFNSRLLQGFTAANLLALAIIGLSKYYIVEGDGTLVFSEFVILPMIMGMISAWFWRDLGLSTKSIVGNSVVNGLIAILLSFIFLKEGVICLIIVSPLIFAFVVTGAFIGRKLFMRNNQTLNVSIFAVLLVVFVVDSRSEHYYQNLVADEIIINASPSEVWNHVVAFEKIKQENKYWLFQIGMPSPMQTTVEGNYKGAGRKCIFNNGYVFDEKIVTYEPAKDLTFDIVGQPRDPEIMGHIDILRGQFLLKDNGNGTTTLTGNSWYRLYVFPTWYYDIWAKSITRNVHLRVMDHIKELSEKN